ncbi:MAG: hypothetical protein HYW25_01045 [Candidatus Aenigmarchaeota archaeon]|nr:hypothetical protein [Candidatus Aenigmarchaeota archaeon]
MTEKKKLKERIAEEMLEDYGGALERNFELAQKVMRLTRDGRVHITIDKSKLTGKELIQLYLIGKLYAKEGGIVESAAVSNKELMEELGIVQGSVLPWTKELRDAGRIKPTASGVHEIHLHVVEGFLKSILSKLKSILSKLGGSDHVTDSRG